MWNVYGECENYAVINSAHAGAIIQLVYNDDGRHFYTASTDKTVGVFDSQTCQRIKRLKGHTLYVNSCHPARRGPPLIVSGSDDCTVRVWDQRYRSSVVNMNAIYQVTAVSFGDNSDQVISAGIDNSLKVWDTRKPEKPMLEMTGHNDTVTGMALSPCGSFVLTNAMDNTLRVWDVRPFATGERCTKIFTGHQHNFEKVCKHFFVVMHLASVKNIFFLYRIYCIALGLRMVNWYPLGQLIDLYTFGTQIRGKSCTNCLGI